MLHNGKCDYMLNILRAQKEDGRQSWLLIFLGHPQEVIYQTLALVKWHNIQRRGGDMVSVLDSRAQAS